MIFRWLLSITIAMWVASHALGATPTLEDVLSVGDPLSDRESERVGLLERYRNSDSYPQREGNGISYLYGSGEPSLVCSPLNVCMLALEAGERLVRKGILIGDSTRWHLVQLFVDKSDVTYIALKPVDAGLETGLTVITSERIYHLRLISHEKDYMPLVSFRYPDTVNQDIWDDYFDFEEQEPVANRLAEAPVDVQTSLISQLNWDYEVSTCECPWRPERVYDDGIRTVIDLPESARTDDLPVLVITGSSSEGQLSNYRVEDNTFVVDQLFDEAKLVLGVGRDQQEVVIRRTR